MKCKAASSLLTLVFTTVPAFSQEIDFAADLADLTSRIEAAQADVESYSGGVMKPIAQYRLETLKLNRALLENRQLGEEAGITPELVLPAVSPDPDKANSILADLQKQMSIVAATEAEAKASGGLVQAVAYARLETEKLSLAQLQLAWYQAQYGIATPIITATTPPKVADAEGQETSIDGQSNLGVPHWADVDYPDIDYTAEPFPGLAQNGFRMAGWFAIQETRAEIDDSPKVLAINFSDFNPSAFQDKRRLLLQCSEGMPSIVYDVDSYMPQDYRSNSVRLMYRIDQDEAIATSWSTLQGNQGTGAFGQDGVDMMLKLIDSQKLFLRAFDNSGKSYDASFDMSGMAKAVEAIASACGFSTLDLSKEDLKSIQSLLNSAGFNTGMPDGVWGGGSKAAMKAFQEANGLPATGAPDKETLVALGISF